MSELNPNCPAELRHSSCENIARISILIHNVTPTSILGQSALTSFDLILHRLKEGDKFSLNADGKMFEDDVAMTNTCVEATIN